MAILSATRAIGSGQRQNVRMTITPDGDPNKTIYIPYAPVDVTHNGLGAEFASVSRVGRTDYPLYTKPGTRTMSFSLKLANVTRKVAGKNTSVVLTVSTVVDELSKYARLGTRVIINYGKYERGTWYITKMSLASSRRDERNEIIEADLDLEFTYADDAVLLGTGPLTGGAQTSVNKSKPSGSTSAKRYGPVKRGETLSGISHKLYGTVARWRDIANFNNIRDPRRLQAGSYLNIP